MMSHGLLPDREEMAGEEAAVVPLVHSTDTQCRLRAHNYPRYQGSAVNRAQARGAACLVQPLQGLGPVENSKTIIKPTLNLVCCYCHTVLAIQTTTCKIFLSIGEVLPLSCPSHTTAAAATANKTSPKPCPHGAFALHAGRAGAQPSFSSRAARPAGHWLTQQQTSARGGVGLRSGRRDVSRGEVY